MGIVININSTDDVDVVRTSKTKGPKQAGTLEKNFIDLMGVSKAKREKLLHYAGRDAKEFFQFDAFTAIGDGDSFMRPDADGDCLCSGTTTELMFGASVRVFIAPDTSQIEAVRALKKIQDWIERDADALNPNKVHGMPEDIPF